MGSRVGPDVGLSVGLRVGPDVGLLVGDIGLSVGAAVGDSVGLFINGHVELVDLVEIYRTQHCIFDDFVYRKPILG